MLANPRDIYLGNALVEYGEYGEHELQMLLSMLSKPGCVVEVGANIGTLTVPLAIAAAKIDKRLIAFEPQPFIFQTLCANLAMNAIGNVRAWPYACAAASGDLHFDEPTYSNTGNFGAVSMKREQDVGSVRVPAVALDQILADEPVALIKIDVEGFELDTLQGAQSILEKSRPVLYVENDRIEKSKALIEFIWKQSYRIWWHSPPLFNNDNFYGNAKNLYPNICSFNIIACPVEDCNTPQGLHEVLDSTYHPLHQSK
ncbi:FkbM family methyltransferase [Caballeronia zhejiangensis]|uniref:FkbM family methyltransferase n=1 Tax=Caballeronia zhejiangensis TaxID=871203 RepID=UPI00158F000F|nr:FkbM family methyltransferase [Caballeronia zhejiangensis]